MKQTLETSYNIYGKTKQTKDNYRNNTIYNENSQYTN